MGLILETKNWNAMQCENPFKNLEPAKVWEFFYQITRIPRPSKKEQKICAYLKEFAADRKFEIREDNKGNIVILKDATAGYEDLSAVILQSHVDMVCEKDPGVQMDFDNDPIDAYVDGGWVKARGTTLGADCGIGMALELAVLADASLEHPRIEALFTVDEEQGLTGAMNLGEKMLTGKRMINLDSEDEGEVFIGCAGGVDTLASFAYKPKRAPEHGYTYYNIAVTGLHGGHSGDDIDKGYANANKLLARIIRSFMNLSDVLLAHFDGGNLRNAIPRDAFTVLAIPNRQAQMLISEFAKITEEIRAEFIHTEPGISFNMEPAAKAKYVMGRRKAYRLIAALCSMPNGVIEMSRTMKGLVETSTNLASVKFGSEGVITVTTSQRSSVESARENIAMDVEDLFLLAGAYVLHTDPYPGWVPAPDSPFVARASEVYSALFGTPPKIKALHAGLECGLFLSKYPDLQIISIGPTLRGVHSPSEKLEISTVPKLWEYLRELLADRKS